MKKMTRSEAQAQAKRLQACPALAPQSDEGRKEIVDCLLRNCDDGDHAERAMTRLLESDDNPRNLLAGLAAAARVTRSHGCDTPDTPEACSAMWDHDLGQWVPLRGGA